MQDQGLLRIKCIQKQKNGRLNLEQKLIGIKVAFLTLGCKVNSYETEAMLRLFREQGAEICAFEETADVYVVNTCTVTGIADRKSRQMLHRAKKKNGAALVVAVGCYAQEAGEALLEDEAVDLVIGNNQKSKVAELVAEKLQEPEANAKQFVLEDLSGNSEYENLFVSDVSEKTRAYIKIQDGCNQFCSYCIIPYVRGRIRSRDAQDVIREVTALTEKGYQEVVLTGIHLSSYGNENKAGNRLDGDCLAELILELNALPKLRRIRLGSLEPRVITEAFVNRLKRAEKFCPHFHLSLQSGCDETLKRMNRKYTAEEYATACELLRKAFDAPAITTDVIVGFPGETDEEFETTYRFLEQIRFAQMHIFRYSVRKGTRAEKMPQQVPEPIKALRSDRLLELEHSLRKQYLEALEGKEEEILTEDMVVIGGVTYRSGYSKRYVRYALPSDSVEENVIVTGRAGKLLNDECICLK